MNKSQMIEGWFSTAERTAALDCAARSWLGTPFCPNSAVRGPQGGVSCQKLVAEIYFAAGFIEPLPIPDAAMSHARSNILSLLESFMATRPEFERLAPYPDKILAGDLVGFRIGRTVHHCAVALGSGQFIHAVETLGVCISHFSDPTWFGRLGALWRPINHV